MSSSGRFLSFKFFRTVTIYLVILALFFQPAQPVRAEDTVDGAELTKIIFTAGEEKYEYFLKELSLELIEGEKGKYTICKNPSWLTYQLYQLSLNVKKLPADPIMFLNDDKEREYTHVLEGRELDLAALIVKLGNPAPYQEIYPLPLKSVKPTANKERILNNVPQMLWAQYTTILTNIPDRTENVRIAASQLDGLIIAPGQLISFNELVGPREKTRGFREAIIIVGGKFEAGMGGGVCQVSSTLYNTLLLAGLEIVERHNHSIPIAYVPLGRDATVVFGTKDLKFKNNTPSYLLLRTQVRELKLTMELYGEKYFTYSKINIYTKILKTIPPKKQIITDKNLIYPDTRIVEKGTPGYISETFREFITEENTWEEILSKDYYSPQNTVLAESVNKENEIFQGANDG